MPDIRPPQPQDAGAASSGKSRVTEQAGNQQERQVESQLEQQVENESYGDIQRRNARSDTAPHGGAVSVGTTPFIRSSASSENELPEDNVKEMTLSHEDAVAGSPEDASVAGEEDAGVGLEFMVNRRHHKGH